MILRSVRGVVFAAIMFALGAFSKCACLFISGLAEPISCSHLLSDHLSIPRAMIVALELYS